MRRTLALVALAFALVGATGCSSSSGSSYKVPAGCGLPDAGPEATCDAQSKGPHFVQCPGNINLDLIKGCGFNTTVPQPPDGLSVYLCCPD